MIVNGNKTNIALLDQRVRQLELNYSSMDEKLEKVLTNHLPHIQIELTALKTAIGIATAFNVGAIILGIIISKFLL